MQPVPIPTFLCAFKKGLIAELTRGFRTFLSFFCVRSQNQGNTVNIVGNSQLSKSDFEAKKSNPIQFLRCGNTLKKRCRKYRAKLAILKSIQADFALFFVFIFSLV